MPVWGWALLIGCTGLVMVGALAGIVFGVFRLPSHAPHHGNPEDIGAPMSREAAEEIDRLEHEHEAEADRATSPVG